MSLCEYHFHGFIGAHHVLLVLGVAVQNVWNFIACVLHAVHVSNGVWLSVVLDHLVESAEDRWVSLLFAKVDLLNIRERVRNMFWIVALFLGLLVVSLLHSFQSWWDVLLELSQRELDSLVVRKWAFEVSVESSLNLWVEFKFFHQHFLGVCFWHIKVAKVAHFNFLY